MGGQSLEAILLLFFIIIFVKPFFHFFVNVFFNEVLLYLSFSFSIELTPFNVKMEQTGKNEKKNKGKLDFFSFKLFYSLNVRFFWRD